MLAAPAKPKGKQVGKIGHRQVFFNKDSEKSIDWAEAFAKLIIGDNVEDYIVRNGLYKEPAPAGQGG